MRLRTYMLIVMATATVLVSGFFAYRVQSIVSAGVAEVDRRQATRSAELINMSIKGTLSRLASLSRILRANNDLASAFVLSEGAQDPHLITEKLSQIKSETGFPIVDIISPTGRSVAQSRYQESLRAFFPAALGTKTARPVTGVILIGDRLTLTSVSTLFLYDEPVGLLILGLPVKDAVAGLADGVAIEFLDFALSVQPLSTNTSVIDVTGNSSKSPDTLRFLLPSCTDIRDQTQVLTATFHMPTRDASHIGGQFRNQVLLTALGALIVVLLLVHLSLEFGFVRQFKQRLDEMAGLSKTLARGPLHPDQIASIRAAQEAPFTLTAVQEIKTLHESFSTLSQSLADFQERIAAHARTEAIARMTQMFAHDVRKPFQLMNLGLSILKKTRDPAEFLATVNEVETDIARATAAVNGMINDVMEANSTAPIHREPTNLAVLIESTARETISLHTHARINLELAFSHHDPISVDRIKFGRVISNIVENAVHAIGKQGTIWVTTRDVSTDQLEIAIANDGPPIAAVDIPNLFEPFFTKGKRGGTGLGLSIAKKIVEDHGGIIACHSVTQEISEFRILHPKVSRE